jgi:hypothetical protein
MVTAAVGGRICPQEVTCTPTGVCGRLNGRPWGFTIRLRSVTDVTVVTTPSETNQLEGNALFQGLMDIAIGEPMTGIMPERFGKGRDLFGARRPHRGAAHETRSYGVGSSSR